MGRWSGYGKSTVESYKRIYISNFKKWGYLRLGSGRVWSSISRTCRGEKTGSMSVWVNADERYINPVFTQTDNQTGEKKRFDYKIQLTATDCNYGGVRFWFICPNCKNRFGVLCLHGDGFFYCRKCLNLCYDKQLENKRFRPRKKVIPGWWEDEEASKLIKTIKYPYRNGEPTRKYKRYLKLTRADMSLEEQHQAYIDFERSLYRK